MSGDEESIWDEQDRLRRVRLLEIVGMSQASEEPLNVEELADEFGVQEGTIRMELAQLSALGLILDGLDEASAHSSQRRSAVPGEQGIRPS